MACLCLCLTRSCGTGSRGTSSPGIARAVIQAEPKMRTEVVRHIPRIVKKEPLLTQPDIDEDWAWAR